jgi:glycosyltransferase involved in cell wall biosynthesis
VRGRFRIAFLAGPLGRGGAEQQLYYLLEGLDRETWSPFVIHVSDKPDEYWVGPIQQLGVPVRYVDRSRGRLNRILDIARALKQEPTDIVHSTLLYLNPYAAISGRIARVKVKIGGICEDAPGTIQLTSPLWLGYYGCDILVSNFKAAFRNVPARVRAVRRVVYSGIPVSAPVDLAQRRKARLALGCDGDGPLIGAVGRVDRNKNFGMLIRAFASLAQKWPSARLAIAGDGPMRAELADLAAELGVKDRVLLPGRVPGSAQQDIFPAFDVSCLSSLSEGFPVALLEASMTGLPVVSTICGGTPELVENDVTGYLVGRDDSAAMADGIDRLLANPDHARVLGRAGREKMIRDFDVSKMVRSTEAIYREAVGMRGAA